MHERCSNFLQESSYKNLKLGEKKKRKKSNEQKI